MRVVGHCKCPDLDTDTVRIVLTCMPAYSSSWPSKPIASWIWMRPPLVKGRGLSICAASSPLSPPWMFARASASASAVACCWIVAWASARLVSARILSGNVKELT